MRRAHIYEVAVKLLGLIGAPAHIDGGMGYVFAYNIGYFVYLPRGGGYETQLLLHVAYGGHCSAQIDGGQANHDTRKHGTRLMWYAVYQVHHHGVYYAHYERGGLGDVKVKKFLNNVMQETLRPIRERREALARDPASVMEILRRGTMDARAAAAETVKRVKAAMKLNYFD